MPQQLQLYLPGFHRHWLMMRRGTNPITASGGPVVRLGLPLEARLTDKQVEMQILRLPFDLTLGTTLIGQGEIGPLMHLRTDESPFTAWATIPQAALPCLFDPVSTQGPVNLKLTLTGFVRVRHHYAAEADEASGLGDPDVWQVFSIGEGNIYEIEIPIARSDWYDQVVAKLELGGYLVTALPLPTKFSTWQAVLGHLAQAERAVTVGDPPAVFGYCRAAIDALPGAKTEIFAAMREGKKRDAINELTKQIGIYLHSGRHVVPNSGGEQGGEFPVSQRDAVFACNTTKLLLSQIYSLIYG